MSNKIPFSEQKYRVYLPESLDLSRIVSKEKEAYAAFLISSVVFRRWRERGVEDTTFVPLAQEHTKRFVPKDRIGPLLAELKAKNVLECDEMRYFDLTGKRPGKSFCYRLHPDYHGERMASRLITDHEFLRKASLAYLKDREEIEDPIHIAIRDWSDRLEVSADAPFGLHPMLDLLMDGRTWFEVCDQGRIHSNITTLPAECREYISIDGNELCSVDVSSSQPLLLQIFCRGRVGKGGECGGKGFGNAILSGYWDSYLNDCLSGVVYDRLEEELRKVDGAGTVYDRSETKQQFLSVIYGDPSLMHCKALGPAFRSLYPDVYDAVQSFNLEYEHGSLARTLQTMESTVMIQKAAGRLLRELPEMPLQTVHDSILCPPEYVRVVRKAIKEEWYKLFGIIPRLKVTDWTAKGQRPRPKQKPRKRPKRRLGGKPCPRWSPA